MKLSVIVPVYNMAADGKLEYCLNSLVNQTITDYEIIAVGDSLEQNRIISSINDISGNRLLTNSTMPKKDIQTLENDSYELHWYKICSLIKIGRTEEAKVYLLNFITINGKYKNTADSLLQTLK